MKSKQKLSVLVWHRASKSRKKDGKAPVYVRITIDGMDEEIGTGKMIHPDHWDSRAKKSSENTEEAEQINTYLSEMVSDIEAEFRVLSRKNDYITTRMLKKHTSEKVAKNPLKSDEHTLNEVADLFIADFQEQVDEQQKSDFTLKQWRATANKIKEFAFYKTKINLMTWARCSVMNCTAILQ